MFKRNKENKPKITIEEAQQKLRETPMEKNDLLAIVIAAFTVLLPAVLITLGIFYIVIWFFFLR